MSETGVEAIRVNADERTVSVATLGRVDAAALQDRLTEILRTLDSHFAGSASADVPTKALQVSQTGSDVLIKKPSCPTAPKFWNWRDFEWPEPEEIEKKSMEEWQTLAIQASICGVALVAGFVAKWRRFDHLFALTREPTSKHLSAFGFPRGSPRQNRKTHRWRKRHAITIKAV